MKKFFAILLSVLLVSAFAVSAVAVNWEDNHVLGLDPEAPDDWTFDNAYGFVFNINYVDGSIVGEDNTIITTADAYAACNPNWAISVLLAPTSEANVYEVALAPVSCPGSPEKGIEAGINFEDGNIVLVAHSAYSNDNGTNWEAKVAAMALKVGDKVTLAEDKSTATVQDAPEGYVPTLGVEPDLPAVSENVAAGKTYTTSEQYRQGGADVDWGWDDNAPYAYPDEDGVTMTDGVIAAADADYLNAVWAGWTSANPDYDKLGYNYITVDLGESMALAKFVVHHGNKGLGQGIGVPAGIQIFVSEDGQTWSEEAVGSAEPVNNDSVISEATVIEANATGRYVQFRILCNSWAFISEVEVYNASSSDAPVNPPVDDDVEAELKEALGEANADPKFDLVINAPETYKAGDEITVTVTVKNITAEPGVHVLNFNLVYDNEKLVLTNDLDEEDQNMLVCVDTDTDNGYPKGWENFSKVNCTVADGVATADNDGIIFASVLTDKDIDTAAIKTDDVIVFTFNFTAKEDATGDIGLVIPHESAEGAINDASGATIFAGNGTYAIIAEAEDEPDVPSEDPSEDSSESDTPVKPGDASAMIVFAIIALVAVAGSAVVIKSRK